MFTRRGLFREGALSGGGCGIPYEFFAGVVEGDADGLGGVFGVKEGEAAAVLMLRCFGC